MRKARVFFLLIAGAAICAAAQFGTTYPLVGQFSDLALDEPRSVLYISNFTASRIEVFSTTAMALQPPIRLGINPSAVALAPDGRTLLILNFGSPSLFVLNLENRAVQTIALSNLPRAAAFGSDGAALIITSREVLRFDPATGTTAVLLESLTPIVGDLPVPAPTFPAEILNARTAYSLDRNTIFVVGSTAQNTHFAFFYHVPTQSFTGRCTSLVAAPVRFASIAPDGSRFMGGRILFDRALRVLADFVPSQQLPFQVAPAVPTAPPPNAPPPRPETVIGATEFSRDGSTIYASLIDPSAISAPPLLYVLDSDNLTVRSRILISDRLSGKMISNAAGSRLYALSETGLTVLPISQLASAPIVSTSTDTISFRFNVCNRLSSTAAFDVINRGPGSVSFTLSTDMPGLRLEPSSGTTPARITATFDPDQLLNVRGTTIGIINITSSAAVNTPEPVSVLVNLQDSDQRGTIFTQGGTLRDLLIDELRQRFYILDSSRNRLLVFDLNDFSLKQVVRTGYFPFHMAVARDQRTLLVTNAQSETVSLINLDTLEPEGFVYCPCSAYARSIAVSTNAILLTTAVERGQTLRTADNQQVTVIVTEGRMNRVNLATRQATELSTLGIFQNRLSAKSLLSANPSGSRILIAEDAGGGGALAKIYEADSDTFVVARTISDRPLRGGAAATDTGLYNAGSVMMGASLSPLAEFRDSPDEHNGLVFLGTQIVRTLKPATGGGPGLIARVDTATLRSIRPVKLAEAPLALPEDQPLRRSLAATSSGTKFITLSSSGFVVVGGDFDAFIPPAVIRAVTNAATFEGPVAPGSLISIFGENLASLTTRPGATPLPTFLADSCVTVNNLPVPLLFLSPGQINAQLPFEILGAATMVVHTPGGVSDAFPFDVPQAAPALFRSTFGGQASEPIPTVLRALNQEPITLSNPVRRGEVLVMFINGLGRVSPSLASGNEAPVDLLFRTLLTPTVTIGGRPAEVLFSGLTPGFVGLNQLNIRVPLDAPLGFNIPLEITSGGRTERILVRVAAELER